jgi:hypothetical protein
VGPAAVRTQGHGSSAAQIGGDGQFIIFYPAANNLVPGDTNNKEDVFVRDMKSKTTEMIPVKQDGSECNLIALPWLAINGDGSKVAFITDCEVLPTVANPHKNAVMGSTHGKTLNLNLNLNPESESEP